jgi:hypothetical protein
VPLDLESEGLDLLEQRQNVSLFADLDQQGPVGQHATMGRAVYLPGSGPDRLSDGSLA